MSESQYQSEDPSEDGWPQRVRSGDEMLPPVEPPPAGFILKLFVIPALIVLVLLAVWQVPKWLVRRTSAQPNELIQRLEQGASIARFQTAFDLANRLRDGQLEQFRRDSQAAGELAGILERQVEQGGMDEEEVNFRMYLAKALGEFEVQDGVGALVKAAETNRHEREQIVRDAAVQAIATRAYKLQNMDPPQQLSDVKLEPALMRLASDEEPVIRSRTAIALGKLGTPAAMERLETMVGDPYPDASYHAAMELALHGNSKAIETLAEMLDLSDLSSAQEESDEASRNFKREVIVSNAIRGTQELAQRNASADFSPVIDALERIASADRAALHTARISPGVLPEVRSLLKELGKRAPVAVEQADTSR
jgi:HEAT repeat protein